MAKNSMVKIMEKQSQDFIYLKSSQTHQKEYVYHMQKLLEHKKPAAFPNICLIDKLPAIRYDFLMNKVKLFRTSIDQHKLPTLNSTIQTSLTIFYSIHPVTITYLHTIIKSSKPNRCATDPTPISLLLECPDDILPTLTHIINTSKLYCQFPASMKTTIVNTLPNMFFRHKQI